MRTAQLAPALAAIVALATASPVTPACQVTIEGDELVRCGEPFRVKGANYYPATAAWHRFWTEYDSHSGQIDAELDRARELGANTLRIFLIFGFFADGSSPHLPKLADFLDRLQARGLVALVTFFDFYRDSPHPYCDAAGACDYGASRQHVDAVLAAVGDHPAVFGWDLKNEMDLDYGASGVGFTTGDVKAWARFMTDYLRDRTDRPVTLGFSGATPGNTFDPEVVAEFACDVDVVSFHWFLHEGLFEESVASLQARLGEKPCPARPLLLEEFGLHTRACPPGIPCEDDPHTEADQAAYYNAVFGLSEAARLAGELFWTLNDFSFVFPGASPMQHCMGVLRNSTPWAEPECDPPASSLYCHCEVVDPVDYAEKPAAGRVRAHWQDLFYLDLLDSWVDPNAGPPPPGWKDNFADENGKLLGGAIWRGYNPAQLLWSHTPGHAALTKSVASDGVSIVGWARSPLLREVDLERFPFLAGRVSSYTIKDPTFGRDALLHVGVATPGAATTRLLTVTPEGPFPLDFRLDLRDTLDPATAQTFEMVLELEPVPPDHGYSASYEFDSIGLYGGGNPFTCIPDNTTLCLNNDRFRVRATFETASQSGQAQVVELTNDTGYLWFFSASNVEAVVKVLNACAFNNRYWVFAGGLTDVRTVITVSDSQTGASKTYINPQGTPFQPIQDTQAFATCPAPAD